MRKKHGSVPKLHTCSGLDSHNEQKTLAFEVPLQTELRFPLRRYEQPHSEGEGLRSNGRPTNGTPSPAPAAATTTTSAPGGRTAATLTSGWMPLPGGPRPCQNYIHVQASTATMNKKHWHSKCCYKRNSGSPSAGTNNPTPWGKACGATEDRRTARRHLLQQRRRR